MSEPTPSIVSRLARSAAVHRVIRTMRLQEGARAVLDRFPMQRRTAALGLRYRVRFLESLLVADEIFKRRIYDVAFAGRDVRTFIDVGCNVGYLPVYIADRTRNRDAIGLAIDANPDVIDEAYWHVQQNGLARVRVLRGLVGHPRGTTEATLFIAGSNVSASAQPKFNPNYPLKADVETVTVPCVDTLSEWKRLAGDARIDLLKLDIEGFEETAIANLPEILALTDAVIIEWHNWMTSRDRVAAALRAHGFSRMTLVSEDADAGIGLFTRD